MKAISTLSFALDSKNMDMIIWSWDSLKSA